MKQKEKPKYGIWQNICFSVKLAWQTRKRVLVFTVTVAGISVLLNLVQLYIAPEILSKVEQQASLGQLLVTIGSFTAALIALCLEVVTIHRRVFSGDFGGIEDTIGAVLVICIGIIVVTVLLNLLALAAAYTEE